MKLLNAELYKRYKLAKCLPDLGSLIHLSHFGGAVGSGVCNWSTKILRVATGGRLEFLGNSIFLFICVGKKSDRIILEFSTFSYIYVELKLFNLMGNIENM